MSLYDQIASEGLRLPSEMGIFGRYNASLYTFESLNGRLLESRDFEIESFTEIEIEDENPSLQKQFLLNIVYKGIPYEINLFTVSSHAVNIEDYARINTIDEEDVLLPMQNSIIWNRLCIFRKIFWKVSIYS